MKHLLLIISLFLSSSVVAQQREEENGTQQEVSYKTTSDKFTDYFTLRITRNGNAWKGEWIVNDTILRTLEATTPLDISNKLGFCSYSWYNYNSDELYVKNIKNLFCSSYIYVGTFCRDV